MFRPEPPVLRRERAARASFAGQKVQAGEKKRQGRKGFQTLRNP